MSKDNLWGGLPGCSEMHCNLISFKCALKRTLYHSLKPYCQTDCTYDDIFRESNFTKQIFPYCVHSSNTLAFIPRSKINKINNLRKPCKIINSYCNKEHINMNPVINYNTLKLIKPESN